MLKKGFLWIAANPLEAALIVFAFAMLAYGLYFASPWYVNSGSALAVVFDAPLERILVGALTIVPAYSVFIGLRHNDRKKMYAGGRSVVVGYVFLTALNIIVGGFFPVGWLFILAGGIVTAICTLSLGVKGK